MESNQIYPIHRNKHREAAKLKRQRNMAQMKEQIKNAEKEQQNRDSQPGRCRVSNTGDKDA